MHQYELSIGIHMFPPAWTPSHLPHQPIPLGYHRGLVLSLLHNTSNLHWLSILHMVIYMFQCYSLKSSHYLLLPLSQKVFLYICVSFAALHVGSLVPFSRFHIYVLVCLFQFWFSWGIWPAVGLLGCMAVLFPVFQGISTQFSIISFHPTNIVKGFPFLHTIAVIYYL